MPRMLRRLALALLVGGLFAVPEPSSAQTTDAVAISPAAGTASAVVYSLEGGAGKVSAVQTGRRRLVRSEIAPASFSDFKILADGTHLLADFADRGVGTTDDRGTVEFQLAPAGERPGISSASAAGYDDADQLERLLFADENQRILAIYDRPFETVVWSNRLDQPAAPLEVVQSIALPGQRVAAALNWPALQVTAIDIYDLSADDSKRPSVRFANDQHSGAPDNLVTDSALDELRDLFALDGDRLLATTSEALLVVSLADQTIEQRLTLNDRAEFAGAFNAARKLPSGRIAVATVEPGVWTQSHPNHRVYWLDNDLSSVIARTSALQSAPWRIEPVGGHGGSGTADFRPDLSFLPTSTPAGLELVARPTVRPDPTPLQTPTTAEFELRNPTPRPIYLGSAALRANPDGCEASDGWRNLVERTRLVLAGASSTTVRGSFELPEDVSSGGWCARVRVDGREGAPRELDPPREFTVGAESIDGGSAGRKVDPIDLGLRHGGDAGSGSNGSDDPRPTKADGGGRCGCGAASPPGVPTTGLLAIGLLLVVLRRQY